MKANKEWKVVYTKTHYETYFVSAKSAQAAIEKASKRELEDYPDEEESGDAEVDVSEVEK